MKKRTCKPKPIDVNAIIEEVYRQKGILFIEEEKEKLSRSIIPTTLATASDQDSTESKEIKKEMPLETKEKVRMLKGRCIPVSQIAKTLGISEDDVIKILGSLSIDAHNELLSQIDSYNSISLDYQPLIGQMKIDLERAVPGSKEHKNLSRSLNETRSSQRKHLNDKVKLLMHLFKIDKSSKKPEKLTKPETELIPKGEVELTPEQIEERRKSREKALDIMKNGKPLKYILDSYNKLHVGDRDIGKILLASIISLHVKNSHGIQPSLIGMSQGGKTHCCDAMLLLVYRKYIFGEVRTPFSFSDKALFYSTDLKPRTIVYNDDANLSKDLENIIKTSTSSGFRRGTMHRTKIGRESVDKKIPPRLTWWLTSVDPSKSAEILNRQFVINIDESEEHLKKVEEHGAKLDAMGKLDFSITEEVKICREIFGNISEQKLFKVIIPFKITYLSVSTPSDSIMFRDAIKAFTILRYMQRKKDDGKFIATIDDFKVAKSLFNRHMKERTFDLTEKQREAWDIIYRYCSKGHDHIDRETLSKKMNYKSVSGVAKLLEGMRKKKGLLGNKTTDIIQETQGEAPPDGGMRPYYYSTTIPPGESGKEWVTLGETKKASKRTTKESRTASSKSTKSTKK